MASRQPNTDIYNTLLRLESAKPELFASLRSACLEDTCRSRGNGRFIRLSKKFPKLLERLQQLCPGTPVSLIERSIRFMRENKCEVCGKSCNWNASGPQRFCGNACCKIGFIKDGTYHKASSIRVAYYQKHYGVNSSSQLAHVRAKTVATMIERYGHANALQVPSIKASVQKTNVERYGGISPFCSREVQQTYRDNLEYKYGNGVINPSCIPGMTAKKLKNSMRKHGVPNANMLPEVKAKITATYKSRTGYSHQMRNPEVAQRVSETWSSFSESKLRDINLSRVASCLDKYGVFSASMLPEVKAKMKATYKARTGYDHPMHNPEVTRKITIAQGKRKEWVDQFGNIHECRGCEPTVLSALEDAGAIIVTTDFGDMPEMFYSNPVEHRWSQYQPDALIVWNGEKFVVEAKQYDGLFFRGNEYKKNNAKFKAANQVCGLNGMRFMLAIHDKDRVKVVKDPSYTKLETILHQKFPERFDETV